MRSISDAIRSERTTTQTHPFAALFPELPPEELTQLARDIKERGLLEPIILYEGLILDGRNRYRACQIAGVKPRTENVREADLLLSLRSIVHMPSHIWWVPRTLVYSPLHVLPLFVRFEQSRYFKTLCELIDVPNKKTLVEKVVAAEQIHGIGRLFQTSMNPTSIRALMNLERLDTLN